MRYGKYLSAFVFLLLFGCAGQRPPTGGEIDLIPPEIIFTNPENLELNFNSNKIDILFSEYVDRRSVEESIFLSPAIKNLEFVWSGKLLTINFSDSLIKNVTYVLTIGTDVVDLNNRNKMENSFSLAFATGNKIDKSIIEGKVYDSSPQGIMIFAYHNLKFDTIDIKKHIPNFISQTGKDGSFKLTNLKNGNYRIFAIKDEFRNLIYDFEIDKIGIPPFDINNSINDSSYHFITFKIFSEDSIKPRLIGLDRIDKNHLKLTFNESIDIDKLHKVEFIILDKNAEFKANYKNIIKGKNKNEFTLSENINSDEMKLLIREIYDENGNKIDTQNSEILIPSSELKDTLSPKIIYSNIINNKQIQNNEKIIFEFNDVVKIDKNLLHLYKNDSIKVDFKFNIITNSKIEILPNEYDKNFNYKIVFLRNSFSDLSNNYLSDSAINFNYTVFDNELFGSISGRVNQSIKNPKKIIVELINIDNSDLKYSTFVNENNEFEISEILEGEYNINYFEDKNGNNIWDKGNLSPFINSEIYFEYPKIIKIRARWPLEGINLNLF